MNCAASAVIPAEIIFSVTLKFPKGQDVFGEGCGLPEQHILRGKIYVRCDVA